MSDIAIVGMACRYPDATSPEELWDNVLAQRRAFRRLPPERLSLDDYAATSESMSAEGTYSQEAAVLENYEFDRARFRIAGETFRSADMAHWLALDVASQALSDAGFEGGDGLPREATGVLLGNTLTGEFSRANTMRLRWPYVRRVVEATLREQGWASDDQRELLEALEARYKAPFPPVGEETLAGGLSNTIAGRICNYFDLNGGGYTVDGACASSLLAIAHACTALVNGDLDVALAGGVDLSLDPFELVGFAQTGALAADEMRVYDARSAGFWPGEGCGFVVLMRHEEAVADHRRIDAVIKGWGISSDGSGGITRPEVDGQQLALQRAYRRAGVGIETVPYFEGHGTGTSVGDATELRALSRARRKAGADGSSSSRSSSSLPVPAAIGSVKANIGHTKAAAGAAGLIKAAMALRERVIPPTTGCHDPHPVLSEEDETGLEVTQQGQAWPVDRPLRAGVSSMGFGGINAHLVLEGHAAEPNRRKELTDRERTLLAAAQDAELVLLSARNGHELGRHIDHLLTFASRLSRSELTDLAAQLARRCEQGRARAAVVAATPTELADRLSTLKTWLTDGETRRWDPRGISLGVETAELRIGFLFPGQGSPAHQSGGRWRRRFRDVESLYARTSFPIENDGISTELAQPAIVTASLAALQELDKLGIEATVGVGHSLGELTAYHWAGALARDALQRVAAARGQAMAELGSPTGAMASIGADQATVQALIGDAQVAIAGINTPRQTVISGESEAVDAVMDRARAQGLRAVRLPVSHAFHSPLVEEAVPPLVERLAIEEIQPVERSVVSTVSGERLDAHDDLSGLLARQVTAPVRFAEAVRVADPDVDLWIEVGPGQTLSRLAADLVETPAIALDACGPSLAGLLQAVGVAHAWGAPVDAQALFQDRFTRPFDLDDWTPRFLVNPCEQAPASTQVTTGGASLDAPPKRPELPSPETDGTKSEPDHSDRSPLETVRRLVAAQLELPDSAVQDDARMLSDLHLNSITVSQIVTEAAQRMDLAPPTDPTEYADATVAQIAQSLEESHDAPGRGEEPETPAGVDRWIVPFITEYVERPLPESRPVRPQEAPSSDSSDEPPWRILAPLDHPLSGPLQRALARSVGSGGVAVCLPSTSELGQSHVYLLLEGAQDALARAEERATRFVLVQQGVGASVARTLHLEAPHIATCVVDVPVDRPEAAEWVAAEVEAADEGYVESRYDASGRRYEPILRRAPNVSDEDASASDLPLGPEDVLLVTGGGKGIAAECALALARTSGARLALIGRSDPERDEELAANLERFTVSGIDVRYRSADVTRQDAVQAAVTGLESDLGPVTAALHGAGVNDPRRLSQLDEAQVARALAPKVEGVRNVLDAIDPERLRLLITFGSITARTGLAGEAHYALANEWLSAVTERFQRDHPSCRCLALEWSVWSGVGMGERLGRIEALTRQGVTPMTPEEGTRALSALLAAGENDDAPDGANPVSLAVTGRFGNFPTLQMDRRELPDWRFLETPRLVYPDVELIADAEISPATDPYLDDHVLQGERVFPAVMGLEAMAQAAMALVRSDRPPIFEDVEFARSVTVAPEKPIRIRVAALARDSGRVEVVLRSEETAFQIDHFRARCRFGATAMDHDGRVDSLERRIDGNDDGRPLVPIDPKRDLYGSLLFQGGRFQRLRAYRRLRATECVADVASVETSDWFGPSLPQELVLGDPAARDAAIHAIQACIPHATLLPIGVRRLVPSVESTAESKWSRHRRVQAWERDRQGRHFTYDLDVTTPDGGMIERWEGLQLTMMTGGQLDPEAQWAAPLLGPYVERRLRRLCPSTRVSVALRRESSDIDRRTRSDRTVQQANGGWTSVRRRADGKPEVTSKGRDLAAAVSIAHAGDLSLAVADSNRALGCDVEPIRPRSAAEWDRLLGADRFALAQTLAHEAGEDVSTAATRVWTAGECLRKAGTRSSPLVLRAVEADGWVVLASGPLTIATDVARVQGHDVQLALAILVGEGDP